MVHLERSANAVPRLLQREASPSTNSELVALAVDPGCADLTTLVTTDQTAGRGRLDRVWSAPAGTALAISILVRLDAGAGALAGDALGWLPLAAGAALSDAVASVLPANGIAQVGVKWPNDVQIAGRKVCGILSELLPAGDGVVIGAGVNVTMSADQLPVPTATSLSLAGAETGADESELFDRVLASYLLGFTASIAALRRHEGDAERSGVRADVVERCTTIGRDVRVELPGGTEVLGSAIGIDRIGRLEVREDSPHGRGVVRAVAAGDIIHLRSTR